MGYLSDQLKFDIFVTALEGGIGYWAVAENYHWKNADGSEDLDGFNAIVRDFEDKDAEPKTINATVIVQGVRKFAEKFADREDYIGQAARAFKRGDADVDYDADVADIIVQLALFDEVVYG